MPVTEEWPQLNYNTDCDAWLRNFDMSEVLQSVPGAHAAAREIEEDDAALSANREANI